MNRKKPTAHKRVQKTTGRLQTIPRETAPPTVSAVSANNAAAEAQQRAADAKLLKQQEAQSDKAAQINDEQVRRAQQRKDAQQNEIRIQDAPGPAQTGVVPAAGPPVIPPQANQRIQDQPSPVPGQNTTPPQG